MKVTVWDLRTAVPSIEDFGFNTPLSKSLSEDPQQLVIRLMVAGSHQRHAELPELPHVWEQQLCLAILLWEVKEKCQNTPFDPV